MHGAVVYDIPLRFSSEAGSVRIGNGISLLTALWLMIPAVRDIAAGELCNPPFRRVFCCPGKMPFARMGPESRRRDRGRGANKPGPD